MFYTINVTPTEPANQDPIVMGGGRDLKVVAYLANVAVKALEDSTEKVAVTLTADGNTVTHFTGEGSDAAVLLKARLAKLRADQPVNARAE